jgi:phosphoglycerol transferase MdoB-like AlkP superfamily enzyme
MNIIEFGCFVGLPSLVAFVFLIGTTKSFQLAIGIGFGSALISLFIVILLGFIYRLFQRRLPQKSPVFIWGIFAVLLSASFALFCRLHHIEPK